MTRILALTADRPPVVWSGIGVTVARQVRALADLQVEVTVLVSSPGGRRPLEVPIGVQVLPLHGARFPTDPRAVDMVHLHSLALAPLALELQRRFRLPLVYTVHGLVHLELAPSPVARRWSAVQRQMLAACDRAVFLSEAERASALALEPTLARRTLVIPNGMPPAHSTTAAGPDGPLVFAGRFAASKGMELLAGFAGPVMARRPMRLVLAGGHGDAEGMGAVADLCRRFPGRCEVKGWLGGAALEALLASAALVLVPSRYEPFGLVALEAMAAGAPVLAAAVGGLAEVAAEGSGGRLVASQVPQDWAAATLDLLRDCAARAELGRRGPPWVAGRFSIREVAQRLRTEAYA